MRLRVSKEFIQQLSLGYIARGYFFCVQGHIPCGKNPVMVDDKLLRKYEIRCSKVGEASSQEKRGGKAPVHSISKNFRATRNPGPTQVLH